MPNDKSEKRENVMVCTNVSACRLKNVMTQIGCGGKGKKRTSEKVR